MECYRELLKVKDGPPQDFTPHYNGGRGGTRGGDFRVILKPKPKPFVYENEQGQPDSERARGYQDLWASLYGVVHAITFRTSTVGHANRTGAIVSYTSQLNVPTWTRNILCSAAHHSRSTDRNTPTATQY